MITSTSDRRRCTNGDEVDVHGGRARRGHGWHRAQLAAVKRRTNKRERRTNKRERREDKAMTRKEAGA